MGNAAPAPEWHMKRDAAICASIGFICAHVMIRLYSPLSTCECRLRFVLRLLFYACSYSMVSRWCYTSFSLAISMLLPCPMPLLCVCIMSVLVVEITRPLSLLLWLIYSMCLALMWHVMYCQDLLIGPWWLVACLLWDGPSFLERDTAPTPQEKYVIKISSERSHVSS